MPDPSFFEAEIIVEESKRYKSPSRPVDEVPAELVKAGDKHYVLRSTKVFLPTVKS
jgi:hypothetical protein